MLAGFLDEEEGRLGVDGAHPVIFGLADLDDGLLQYLADGVDGDVRTADGGDSIGEQFLDGPGAGQVGLEGHRFRARSLDGGNGRIGIRLAGGAVVVDRNGFRAMGGEIAGDQSAEVLRLRR
mgnify:CR=1 FL=1